MELTICQSLGRGNKMAIFGTIFRLREACVVFHFHWPLSLIEATPPLIATRLTTMTIIMIMMTMIIIMKESRGHYYHHNCHHRSHHHHHREPLDLRSLEGATRHLTSSIFPPPTSLPCPIVCRAQTMVVLTSIVVICHPTSR